MSKKRIYKEEKVDKIKRRREAKAKRYSKRLNIKIPTNLPSKVERDTYIELYRVSRKKGVDATLLERINGYNYDKDIAKLGNRVERIKVEIALLCLSIDMATKEEVDPMATLKRESLQEAIVLDALAINTLWLELKEQYCS